MSTTTPQPPYPDANIPDRFRTIPWDQLPPAIKVKITPAPAADPTSR
jgi:hypothetical protein